LSQGSGGRVDGKDEEIDGGEIAGNVGGRFGEAAEERS
jgi:hypothetical protein